MIVTDVYFCFASWVTFGIAVIVNVLYWSVWDLRDFLQVIEYSSFCSNILQFNIDQLRNFN